MLKLLAIFVGGGLGSLARYGISRWLPPGGTDFPTGTLAANFLACVVLGLVTVWFIKRADLPQAYQLLVLTGFCGGFSTFSTFSMETFRLIEAGQWGLALLYVSLSFVLCVGVIFGIMRWLG